MRKLIFVALAAVASASAFASFTYLPNGFDTVEGDGFNKALTQSVGQSRRYQFVIDANRLSSIGVGDQITGISFRADIQATNPATWPASDGTFSSFVMTIGAAATSAATASTTFASNRSGVQTTVYSGSYTIPQGSYVNNGGAGPNPWGPELVFQTPFIYAGGNLCIEFAHSGTNLADALFHDAVTDNVNNGVRAIGGNTSSSTAGNITSFTVSRLSVTPAPEPGELATVGLGLLALGIASRRFKLRRTYMPK